MSFFKKLFNSEEEPLKGKPLEHKKNEVHIKRIEVYTEGGKYAYFHFPGFERDIFCIEIIEDEFTNSKSFKPHGIHSYMADKVHLISRSEIGLHIGLLTENEKCFLTFGAYRKHIKFNLGDKVSLLFEDGEIWEFEIDEKGYRVDKDSDGVIFESKSLITPEKIIKLSLAPLKKWRYFDSKEERAYTNQLDSLYEWTTEKRNVQEMAIMFDTILHKSDDIEL